MLASTALASLSLGLSALPALPALPQRTVQEIAPPASLLAALPGDALFVLAIEDFATLWERAPHTAWGKLASEPVLAPMWARLEALVRGELGDELSNRSALDAVQGGAFFVGPQGRQGEDSQGLVLRLRPGFSALAWALRERMERSGGGDREAVDRAGRSMLVGRGGGADSWEVFFTWSEGIAAVETAGREQALQLATTLAQRLETGTSDGVLAASLAGKRPEKRTTFEAYLDVGALAAASLHPYGEQEESLHAALQLDDFGWGTLHFALGEDSAFDLTASLELSRARLWPLLATSARPAPTRLARLAPAESIEVATLGYDARSAWYGLKAWLALELPDFHEELVRHLANLAATTNIDLEEELFGQFSGEFGRLLLPLPGDEQRALNGVAVSVLLGLLGPPGSAATSVYLIALEDSAVVERLVEKLIGLSDAAELIQEGEVAGRRLRFFEVPELELDPSWAFVDDVLVLSTHRSGVSAVLEQAAGGPPYAWLDDERGAALRAGGTAVGSSVADLAGLTRVKLAAPLALLLGMAAEMPARPDENDASLSFEAIAATLPGLVDEHVSGTARTTLSIDGRVLRYRFWAE